MDAVEEIKSRLTIEDVVGQYVELRRAGRNLKGLSPFQNEKTASFMVSPEKQIWHDFSSNKGGNMFSFIMEMEGVDFKGALEILARKAGVDLEAYGSRASNSKLKNRLTEINELACKYFQQNLPKNPDAAQYLTKKRRFSRETIVNFRLGYAPLTDDGLVRLLKKRGYTDDELVKAGVAVRRRFGLGDMFRGRVMVTLMDQMGAVIGFTARQLQDEPNSPKYINTPQTLLYDKSRHIYALSQAKDAIRTSGYAVIVEGNLDVVSSHQAGIRQCVATAGTAMTEQHLKGLGRFTSDIRLAYDRDGAGLKATERAIELAQGLDVRLSIIDVGDQVKDPDELIQKDPALWIEAVDRHQYAMDWLFMRYQELYDLKTAEGKRRISDALLKAVRKLRDDVEREHYLDKLAELTDVSREAMRSKLRQTTQDEAATARPRRQHAKLEQVKHDIFAYQDQLLGLLLLYPTTRRVLETTETEPEFVTTERQYIFEFIATNPTVTIEGELPDDLQSVKDHVNVLLLKAEELYRILGANERLVEAHDLVRRLERDNKKTKQAKITEHIREAEAAGNNERVAELLEQFKKLIGE